MKRFNWLLLGVAILSLAIIALAGCVSKSEYEALQAEQAALVQENNSLKAELEKVQGDLTTVQADLTNAQAEYDTLKGDHEKLSADYEAASVELAGIKEVYPAKRFPDADVLEAWLIEQPNFPQSTDAVLWYSHALQVQEKALEDGYIINAELYSEDDETYSVYCTAILEDGSYYWWDPETDNIYYWLDVKHF